MAKREELARYRANWQGEIDGAALYRTLADIETQPQLAEVYRRLADTEEKHAAYWERQMAEAGAAVPARKHTLRTRVLMWLARRFGAHFVLPTVTSQESSDSRKYDAQSDARSEGIHRDERSHAKILQAIGGADKAGMEGSVVARLEGRHRAVGGNALRAAVMGANDGLVSNLSLVMGVAGAAASADFSHNTILVTGLAGLLAGAFSMAMGEWLSVQSSRELYERQIKIEQEELATSPEEEEEELALIYQAKGLPEREARQMAAAILRDTSTALDTLAREELGIDPEELGGSALEAAVTSFVLFAAGAIVPVIPFLFPGLLEGTSAVLASLALGSLGMFGIGAAITLMTGRSVLFTGGRQLLFGWGAAGITYAIGRLIGVSVAG